MNIAKKAVCERQENMVTKGQVRRAYSGIVFAAYILILLVSWIGPTFAQDRDLVKSALMVRHVTVTQEQLLKLAGGEDLLVKKLLELRLDNAPFVGVRAEKFLLSYVSRPEVRAAMEQDLQSPNTKGLARVIVVHMDHVADVEARQALAKLALDKAKQDNSFVPYARSLTKSNDPQLRQLARETLQ